MLFVKKISICAFLIFGFLLAANFSFAQSRPLEVPLPVIPGVTDVEISQTPVLPDYVRYIFTFAIVASGLVAFAMLVYGGFRHLISAGNPTAMADANDQIFSGLIGIVVILSSWLVLRTINPMLLIVDPGLQPSGLVIGNAPGIYLCKENTGVTCDGPYVASINSVKQDFEDKANYIKFIDDADTKYGVVLHERRYREGKCQVIPPQDSIAVTSPALSHKVSSLTIFRQADSSPGEGVSLYQEKDYNRRCRPQDNCQRWPSLPELGYTNVRIPNLNERGKSIKINEEGSYLAAVFEGESYAGECEVFTFSEPDLSDKPIGICGFGSNWGCFGSMIVLPLW